MNIILAPEGTEGDIRPILALGCGLRDAGHTVSACVPPDFLDFYISRGIPANAMSMPVKTFMAVNSTTMAGNPIRTLKPMLDAYNQVVDDQFSTLLYHARDADLIVGAGLQFAGSSVAEKYGIAYRHAVHVPVIAPSAYYPPPITHAVELPHIVNKALWTVYSMAMSCFILKPINLQRRKLGLTPTRDILRFFMRNMLLAMDRELSAWPPDINDPTLTQTAYWQFPDERELDEPLCRFIERGDAPVYFGFGSMPQPDPAHTAAIIRSAVKQLGIRAVVCSGWSDPTGSTIGDDAIFTIVGAPHLKLFPHMAAIVHHGGAGTTHTASLCGKPHVIIPHILDQYYWGSRMHHLNLGPKPLAFKKLTPERLAAAVNEAISSPLYRENSRKTGEILRKRNGIAEAVTLMGQMR